LPVISIPEEEAITKIVLSLMHISSGITVIAGLTSDDLILKYIK
jgi:hypothetical protein